MGNITVAFVFVWTLNILVFLSQAAMIDLNPDSIIYYTADKTILEKYSTSKNITMPESNEISNQLDPTSSGQLEETSSGTGLFFIDAINSVKNWIQDRINYFVAIVLGPYNLLNSTNLPAAFVTSISLIWYGVSILLLIAFIFGRNV